VVLPRSAPSRSQWASRSLLAWSIKQQSLISVQEAWITPST